MNTRTAITALATVLTLTACSSSSDEDTTANKPSSKPTTATPNADRSAAEKAAGLPPEPTGAKRTELLNALAKAAPAVVRYEGKAIDAARNQCMAINGGAQKLDYVASQRFTYKDVTTTEAQGKQINEALQEVGFCKV